MTRSLAPPRSDPLPGVRVMARRSDGQTATSVLQPGSTLTVGSSRNCGLPLEGDTVAPIQCLLRLADGQVWVQQWYSSRGTLVNGQPVADITPVSAGDEIRVGEYTIRWENMGCPDGPRSQGEATGSHAAFEPPAPPERPARRGSPLASTRSEALPPVSPRDRLAAAGSRDVPDPVRGPFGASGITPGPAALALPAGPAESACVDQEILELLRGEVEHLQEEIALRDQQLAELQALVEEGRGDTCSTDRALEEGGSADARVEELLQELARSDDRIAQLEETLRWTEEASSAEKEERRQLESWVGDIERRVGQREAEWKAEQELMRERLALALTERDALQGRLRSRLAETPAPAGRDPEVDRWREKHAELLQQLQELERQRDRLSEQLQESERQRAAAVAAQADTEATLREEHVRLARERAVLARQQAELASARAELERLSQLQHPRGDNIDSRLRMFREHLREIHDREQQARSERGLAARIAGMWRRLEG